MFIQDWLRFLVIQQPRKRIEIKDSTFIAHYLNQNVHRQKSILKITKTDVLTTLKY